MALRAEGLEDILSEDEIQQKIVYLVGIWLEALLYGFYLCLFVAAANLFIQKDGLRPFSSKVFFVGNLLIFLTISFHNGLNLYRLITGFGLQIDIRRPLVYLNNLKNWEAFAAPVLLGIVIWIGDALVIYRCFLLWQRSYRVIALPILLYLASISTHAANFWWIKTQFTYNRIIAARLALLYAPWALYCAQNVLTSGLIIWKIWAQYRRTAKAGMILLNTPSLGAIMRILVESATIYTTGIIVTVAHMNNRWGYALHCWLFPTIGIVFMLMALRVHAVHEDAKRETTSASLLPSWFSPGEDERSTSTPSGPTTEEGEVHFADNRSENAVIRNGRPILSDSRISDSGERV